MTIPTTTVSLCSATSSCLVLRKKATLICVAHGSWAASKRVEASYRLQITIRYTLNPEFGSTESFLICPSNAPPPLPP
ncbi:hypothetical protein CC77DRAFT_1015993 [Alternaria alternata]|uniref:Uncharacterized protein n=1 Tax=Alternaria alternata TaxID=5599 RepID=A0A177E174_ALTAL|nr:hypothetical protein CC77DRAFT_1015993 [Alternaria alternata]OAG24952.1 hypothetical protein CC77DRAFT_1015993 [Alternaria alternata]